jgi:DNA-3-methyladenine glycosylase II
MSYLLHLRKDKVLKKILKDSDEIKLKKSANLFLSLCGSVTGQQLSTKVAEVIYNRFLRLYPQPPGPEEVLATPDEILRGIGLSASKLSYIQNISTFALEHGISVRKLGRMSNEEVVEYLTQIKGIGRWSEEMLMMFSMGREDVFAVDDRGIQVVMAELYGLNKADKKQLKSDMLRISAKWSPYRTYACIHLWDYKDNAPKL